MYNKVIGFMVINFCKLLNIFFFYNLLYYIYCSYFCLLWIVNFVGSLVFCDFLLEGLGVFFCVFNLYFYCKFFEINCKCIYFIVFIIYIIIYNCIWYFLDCYMVWYEYIIKEYVSNYLKKNFWKRFWCFCMNMVVYWLSCFM